jgi:ADP-ribose pyrophosphatase YjhB (NUDIX family)
MPSVILNTVKAIIRASGHLLAIRCSLDGATYYTLPGGQQYPGETLIRAIERECREEISCDVAVGDLFLVTERPTYGLGHMVDHYFLCELRPDTMPKVGLHPDARQESVDWIPLAEIEHYHLHPLGLRRVIAGLDDRSHVYCGHGS